MLPGWYGFGSRGRRVARAASRRADCALLAEMHARWPFFRSVLSNMAMVLAKTDLASRVALRRSRSRRAATRGGSFDGIAAEHRRTIELVHAVTGHDDAARTTTRRWRAASATAFPTSIRSITCRSSCCAAIARARPTSAPSAAIHLTINGLAAGLRNSG